MPTREDIVLLASYNAAMNTRLYAAAATLPKDVLSADRGAFFGSVLGTLNHIVAGDTIWLRRFMAHPSGLPSLEAMASIAAPASLAHIYSNDLDALLEHRVRLDAIIEALAAELSTSDLAQPLSYRNSRGEFRKNFGALLLHLFNHQTHHRGQASTLLSQSGVDMGVTDLLEWIPEHCLKTAMS
ncbi:MAG: DinB family protein [Telluria sp.]